MARRTRWRWLAIAVSVLVGVVASVTLIGFALPARATWVETSAVLEASSTELFPLFNSRDGQQRLWTHAWERAGDAAAPPMRIADLGGPDAGVGARMGFFPADGHETWQSVAGIGEILASEPGRRVVYRIDFDGVVSDRVIELEAVDDGRTRVRWSETLSTSHPLIRYALLAGNSEDINAGFRGVLLGAEELVADAQRAPPAAPYPP